MNVLYLRELHLHVGEDVEESHNSVPQTTVSQTLLVPSTRTLSEQTDSELQASQRGER